MGEKLKEKRLNVHKVVNLIEKSDIVDVHNLGTDPLLTVSEKYSKILVVTLDFDVNVSPEELRRHVGNAFAMGSAFSGGEEVTYCVLQDGSPSSTKMLVGCKEGPCGLENDRFIESLVDHYSKMDRYSEHIETYKSCISLILISETTESSL